MKLCQSLTKLSIYFLVSGITSFSSLLGGEALAYQVVPNRASLPIFTPALAERAVEKLVLANGLQVYLISDPGVDQSAAGLAVNVGSWEDLKEYPGTAHFLEHMLFMGTKAYPNESEYMQYIHEHSGAVNAFTAPDRTVYMFSINNDAFEGAVDRFSHFFIDPLLSPQCINRELHAVDQEHAKNIEHDGRRQLMVFKESGNPDHPNSRFSTGNAQTLSSMPQATLKHWYETHYSADRMYLCMISPLPLAEMRELAVDHFSQVPKINLPVTEISQEMASAQQKGHMIFIKPVKDLKQLSLLWEVSPEFAQDMDRKAPFLVASVLGNEGKASLSSVLKGEKIAESVEVSCDRSSKKSLLFSIDITLTEQGLKKVDLVITRVFEALARLKKEGVPPYLFNEIQQMSKLDYQFQSRDDAFDAITRITAEMPYENLASYPEKTKIPFQYDPAFIQRFLNSLRAENCIYMVLADPAKTKITTDRTEKWMKAEYTIKPVSKERMGYWNSIAVNPAILLPNANPYIPTNLSLVPHPQGALATPILLSSGKGHTAYFAIDTRYKVPEVALSFCFRSPLLVQTAQSQALCDLYLRAFSEKLSSSLSQASSAGLQLSLRSDGLKLMLSLQGYSDKAPLFLEEVFAALPQVQISPEEFEIYKSSIAVDYDNVSKELPVRQAMQQMNGILFEQPSAQDKLGAIRALSYETFNRFSADLFKKIYTEAFLYGNLSYEGADDLFANLQKKLPSTPYERTEQAKRKIFVFNESNNPCQIVEAIQRQGSGALLLLQEGGFTFPKRAVQQVLGYALSDAFYDTLRTKQQTAYMASAWNSEEERQLLQFFAVQSSTHSAQDLLGRFELFLEGFRKDLKGQITEGRFESIRSNLITLLKMPPENMAGMAQLLNMLAFDYQDFHWIDKRISSLKALSYEDFCLVAEQFLSRSHPRRLAILMQGSLPQEHQFQYKVITKDSLSNMGAFQTVR